jgi:phosphosulfolactate phosphohydrolase-like enzyme
VLGLLQQRGNQQVAGAARGVKVKKQKDSFITVIGADAKTNKAIEDALLAKVMGELGIFLADEVKAAKPRKAKKAKAD